MDVPSYLIDIGPVLEDLGTALPVEGPVELPILDVGSERFVPRGDGRLAVTLTNTGAGIVATGTVSADVDATCSRCLSTFDLPLTGEVEAFFIAHGREDELPEEQDYAFIEDGSIDLMPAVLAALAIEAPFAPLHDPDCRGICPTCGIDLNDGPCDCAPVESASPFSALKDLFDTGDRHD